MRFVLSLLALCFSPAASAQSACLYVTDDVTYRSERDGETITFRKDGRVAINSKTDKRFSYQSVDCEVELYYNGKKINHLTHSIMLFNDPRYYNKRDGFLDRRGIFYDRVEGKRRK